jgi:3-oxoacyl-[acyl-carrier-protein] synthase II
MSRKSAIAVTGIGVISAVGNDRDTFFQSCRRATSGIAPFAPSPQGGRRSDIACRVADFNPRNYLSQRQFRRMSRVSRMAVAASIDALADSGLDPENLSTDRVGVVAGTSDGPSSQVETFFLSLLENGPRGTQPFYFPETVPNAPASHVAMVHGFTGPNTTFCQNMISAENAIRYAADLLLANQADAVLCGGADEISAMQYDCYRAVGALNRPARDSHDRPIPVPGSGLVLGEGAGFFVMERCEDALAREARIYGRLSACSLAGGAARIGHYGGIPACLGRAVEDCLRDAKLEAAAIGQFNVSANFAREQDADEVRVLEKRFGAAEGLRLSPLKTLLGEFGGVGILRAAASLMSLYRQEPLATLPPAALASETFAPDWQLVAPSSLAAALMTTTTYGGGCSAIVFETADGGDR